MILGVEWFDELELTAKGVTFTVDNMDITSTERVPPQPTCRSTVEGSGYTIAPYFVRQTESGGIHDVSFGIGSNSMDTKSSTTTASLESKRKFISTGYSSAEASPTRCLYSTNLPQVTLGTTSPVIPRATGQRFRNQGPSTLR